MAENRNYLFNKFKEIGENGVMEIDLIKLKIFTEKEILEMREICMSEYYKYFIERGMEMKDLEIELTKELDINKYFKQPKDSKMFKAMYGHSTADGREYINTRKPANATNCGMGLATSQISTYYNERLNEFKERLRPLMKLLYGGPVKRHLSRFGLKLPPSKDMPLHTDMSFIKEYSEKLPKQRDADDPVAYHPFCQTGQSQRYQMIIALNDSDSGWYGYPGAHKKYGEIGEELGWPGKTKTIQKISPDIMDKLDLKRHEITSKLGKAIIWNCGIPHGNIACNKIPRLTMYVNYQPDIRDTVADRIIGLGNQPKD